MSGMEGEAPKSSKRKEAWTIVVKKKKIFFRSTVSGDKKPNL
jgi:hypothetical protein